MVGLSDQAGLNQVQDFVAPVLVGLASENPEEQSGQQHSVQQSLDLNSTESPVAKAGPRENSESARRATCVSNLSILDVSTPCASGLLRLRVSDLPLDRSL